MSHGPDGAFDPGQWHLNGDPDERELNPEEIAQGLDAPSATGGSTPTPSTLDQVIGNDGQFYFVDRRGSLPGAPIKLDQDRVFVQTAGGLRPATAAELQQAFGAPAPARDPSLAQEVRQLFEVLPETIKRFEEAARQAGAPITREEADRQAREFLGIPGVEEDPTGGGAAPPNVRTQILDDGTNFWLIAIDPVTGNIINQQKLEGPSGSTVTVRIPTTAGDFFEANVSPDTAAQIQRDLFEFGTISADTQERLLQEDEQFRAELQFREGQLDETVQANRNAESLTRLGLAMELRGQNIRARGDADANLLAFGQLSQNQAQLNLSRMINAVDAQLAEREQQLRLQVPESLLVTRPNGETVARFRFPAIVGILEEAGISTQQEDFDVAITRVNPQQTAANILAGSEQNEELIRSIGEQVIDTSQEFGNLNIGFPASLEAVQEASAADQPVPV